MSTGKRTIQDLQVAGQPRRKRVRIAGIDKGGGPGEYAKKRVLSGYFAQGMCPLRNNACEFPSSFVNVATPYHTP